MNSCTPLVASVSHFCYTKCFTDVFHCRVKCRSIWLSSISLPHLLAIISASSVCIAIFCHKSTFQKIYIVIRNSSQNLFERTVISKRLISFAHEFSILKASSKHVFDYIYRPNVFSFVERHRSASCIVSTFFDALLIGQLLWLRYCDSYWT